MKKVVDTDGNEHENSQDPFDLRGFATHREANTPSGASAERCRSSSARRRG